MNNENFCKKINYSFSDEKLLDEALTHPSLSKEDRTKPNYQRLEFLGDKVLSLVIGNYLMRKHLTESEGDLSKRQAALVSGETLSAIAIEIGVDQVIKISKGEKNLGGATNKRNLENSLEAIIGGIYLDSGFEDAQEFIMKFWHSYLEKNITPPKDPVSQLQELVQIRTKHLPEYETQKSGGFDHAPNFISKVKIADLEFSATGKSKKEAQKEVAKIALNHLLRSN